MRIEFKEEYLTPEYYPDIFVNKYISELHFKDLKKGNTYNAFNFYDIKDYKKVPVVYYVCDTVLGVKKRLLYFNDNKIYFLTFEIKDNVMKVLSIDDSDLKKNRISYIFTTENEAYIESLNEQISYTQSILAIKQDEINKIKTEMPYMIKDKVEKYQEQLELDYENKVLLLEAGITSAKRKIEQYETLLKAYTGK